MSKVDWINWKTDPKELIKPDIILEKIEDIYSNYKCYMNSVVYESINHELTLGGLNKTSFNVAGTSPANENAEQIIEKIDNINIRMNILYEKILECCTNQRKEEKKQLIISIEDKIKEEEKIIENTINLKEKTNNNPSLQEELQIDDIIKITEDRIHKLKERLDAANSIE